MNFLCYYYHAHFLFSRSNKDIFYCLWKKVELHDCCNRTLLFREKKRKTCMRTTWHVLFSMMSYMHLSMKMGSLQHSSTTLWVWRLIKLGMEPRSQQWKVNCELFRVNTTNNICCNNDSMSIQYNTIQYTYATHSTVTVNWLVLTV